MLTCIQVAYKSSIRIPNFNVSALKLAHLTEDADTSIPRTMFSELLEEGGRLASAHGFFMHGLSLSDCSDPFPRDEPVGKGSLYFIVDSKAVRLPRVNEMEEQASTNISLNEPKTSTINPVSNS